MTLIGFIWAIAAPLLMVGAAGFLYWLLSWTGWSRPLRLTVATVVVVIPVATIWWLDYREFTTVCATVGKPRIMQRAEAEGIYLDSPTANSFGMNYLHQQGFSWLEMRSIYDRSTFERVTRSADGQMTTIPIPSISARYEVRETFEQPYPHTSVDMRRIIDRQSGQLLAQAGSANFNGGRARLFLGAYGSRSYPTAIVDFQDYYYLAQRTLRAGITKK
jgi:hypothetical protein